MKFYLVPFRKHMLNATVPPFPELEVVRGGGGRLLLLSFSPSSPEGGNGGERRRRRRKRTRIPSWAFSSKERETEMVTTRASLLNFP